MGKVLFYVILLGTLAQSLAACGRSVPQPVSARATRTARNSGPVEILTAGGGGLRLSVLAPGTVRVLLTRSATSRVPDSFAVDAALQRASAPYTLEESASEVVVRSAELGVRITKHPLRVALLDTQDHVLSEQTAPVAWQEAGVVSRWQLAPGEEIYGLGDKVKGFGRRGQTFELWNSDAYGWKPDDDPLYKAIPFLLFLNEGQAHGLFLDTPARAQVDVAKTKSNVLSYRTQSGDSLDFYLFAGPEPRQVVRAFSALTGRMPLPPRWALGYHQSRYSYLTEQETRSVAARLRADSIPSDAIWLDIDYQLGNAPFTVDRAAFPHFADMVSELRQAGLHTVLITDPHLKSYQGSPLASGYAPYDSGAAGDHFLRKSQGDFLEAKVWPGTSVFPEFTLTRTRRWWGELYREFVDQGVAGFWNDMNEPASFNATKTLPGFARHRFDDGTTLDHTFVHNAYGGQNARATYEGLRRLRPTIRPFVLTRAAYAGTQRYAATWTGDNSATREHLALSIGQLANLGVSGYAFAGADVGGFVGCPDPELLAEWTELGAFLPFFRNHSAKDSCRREPWVHGEAIEARLRTAIERRYRLLPYLYSVFEEASRSGMPVLRPLWLEYPKDSASQHNAKSFLLGSELLVAPKLVAGNVDYEVLLPHVAWYDTVTETLIPEGGAVRVSASADSVRLFARAGAIIPQQPLLQNAEQLPEGPLELTVWPGSSCSGTQYLDDGQSFAFESGAFRRVHYGCQASPSGLQISSESSGSFPLWWQGTTLAVHGLPQPPRLVRDGAGAPLRHEYDAQRHIVTVHLPGQSADWSVQIER